MKMEKRKKIVLLCLLLGLFLCGCSGGEGAKEVEDQYVVGIVNKSGSSEYWMSVNAGMEDAAADYDMKVIIFSPDSELDEKVQEKQVEELIAQGVDALAVSPIDSYTIPDYIEKMEEENVTAVAFDTGFEGDPIPYIGIDNYKTGYELAKELAEQIGHSGQVGVVSGDLNQMGHRERVEGFKEYMETEDNITVEFIESGYGNLQMSEQKVRALMEEYPDVKGIFTTSAVTAMGLADELSGSGIRIVTVDKQEDSLAALENGRIAALAAQSGYDIGYETIRYIEKLRQGGEEAPVCLDAEILTRENLEESRETP